MTDVSEASFKDKYEQVYDTYLNNISSTPGYKNRSNAVKAVMNFGQAQNSFSYNISDDQMPPILRSNPSRRETSNPPKTVKIKKNGYSKKMAPIILMRKDIAKCFTPQKGSSKI